MVIHIYHMLAVVMMAPYCQHIVSLICLLKLNKITCWLIREHHHELLLQRWIELFFSNDVDQRRQYSRFEVIHLSST